MVHVYYCFLIAIITDFTLKCNGKILHEYCIIVYIVHSLTLSQMKHSGDTFHPLAYTFASCVDNPNGSQVNGGCPASCVTGTICQCSDGNTSGLHMDDIIPDIDTSNTGSWANQLFAICTHTANVPIGFQFHEPVLITSIELNLFICYEWNIPQRQFNVLISTSAHIITPITESILGNLVVYMNEANCNGLTRLIIDLKSNMTSTNYVVKFISQTRLNRLYLGEIVFRNQTSEVSCKLYYENKNFSTRPQAFPSL